MEFTSSSDSVSFASEIQAMLHGFGDKAKSRLDTAIVIQSVVRSQMRETLLEAANVARTRSSNNIQLEDVCFTMRNDPIRVQRLVKYLVILHHYSVMFIQSSLRIRSYTLDFIFAGCQRSSSKHQ